MSGWAAVCCNRMVLRNMNCGVEASLQSAAKVPGEYMALLKECVSCSVLSYKHGTPNGVAIHLSWRVMLRIFARLFGHLFLPLLEIGD